MDQLEQRLATLPANAGDIPDILFFKAVFNENGEEARAVYEKLFGQSEGLLRKVTADKPAQYYYARGFYVKASGFAGIAENTPARLAGKMPSAAEPVPVPEPVETEYAIQVGAFGYRDNAQKMLDLLGQHRLEARIVEREVNGKPLFCVWIAGRNSEDDTSAYARELNRKYNIPYRIVKTH